MNFLQKFFLIIVSLFMFQFSAIFLYAASSLNVDVNGSAVVFPDAEPFIDSKSNRTMIPVRFVSEKLGAEVEWDSSLKVVGIKKSGKRIEIKIGDSFAIIDGEKIQLDAPAVITSSRTYVPLRFVSEVLGAEVGWDSKTMTVSISAPLIDENLQKELESVYSNYKASYKTGNIENIKEYVSTYHYVKVKNALLSVGMTDLPDSSDMDEYSDISTAKLHKVFRNGATIGMVYEKPTKSTSGEEEKTEFIFLKYVEEGGKWKYNSTFLSQKDGANSSFTEEDINESMLIDGKVITDIPLIENVEVPKSYFSIGFVDGYNVFVSINNADPIIIDKGTTSGLIIGGLKKGENTIDFEITPQEGNSNNNFFPEIQIYYSDSNNSKIVVFSNTDAEETGKISKTFMVNP